MLQRDSADSAPSSNLPIRTIPLAFLDQDPHPTPLSPRSDKKRGSIAISKTISKSIQSLSSSVAHKLGTDACKYERVDESFLQARQLEQNALGPWALFVLFASSAICIGSPTVWNTLLVDGYGTLIVSMVLAFVTYACFFAVLLELMVMLPFNGGMAIFARTAFGPFAGFLIGSCEAWEYILFAAQGFWMIGETCSQVFATDPNYAPLYWIPFGIIIFAANMAGVRVFVVVCAVLLFINVFGGMSVVLPSLAYFDPRKYVVDDAINLGFFNITEGEAMPSTVALLWPTGSKPIWPGMVSMLWSVSGLEMAPLVAEEGKDFVKNAPRLMKYALLSIFSVLAYVIVLVPCVPPGISTLVNANDPMIDAFLASYNYDSLTDNGTVARVLYFVLFVPDILLFIAIYVYATSRQIFALSKVGYYPTFVAKVHVKSKTPMYALVFSMAMSLGAALVLQFEASGVAGQAFLNGSLLYAIFAYIAVAFAYLKMRWYYPNLKRPFDLGPIVGPLCAIIVVTSYTSALANLFQKEIFRDTLIVCISKLGVMMLVFVLYQRKRMVETPEELFIQRYLDEAAVGDGSRRDGVDAGAWMRDVREELLEQQARKEREMGENQRLEDVTFLRESHVTKA